MSVAAQPESALARPGTGSRALLAGLGLLAAYQLALAIFMAFAPGTFHSAIGPFGPSNDHYVRDLATYNAALGAGCLIAVRMASWRIPVLTLTVIQFALHSVNHLIDIDKPDPTWVGYFDFFALASATALLVLLLALARVKARNPALRSEGDA
jgi:hypothetical protein